MRVAAVAPAPAWHLTARVVERFGGVVPEPELASDTEVERRLQERTADLAITRRPVTLPGRRCLPLMTEALALLAPDRHPLAAHHEVSFADMAGETFLVRDRVGFWKDVCERSIPDARFIIQSDVEVFFQTVRTSDLLCFTTDAPQHRGRVEGRVAVPISDASARAAFYLVSLVDAPSRVTEVVDWMAASQGA
ncbi:MAG: substrate-binding domain-containing protein [Actinomyces sp.]|uniref:substrate-binding domain-containing protein n=1 Tax=Actinomyces sp. TaxID=29317 RepID=UPI0026DD1B6C|nr:substrate-binding domain-containing protein [Actinomyces sp.]MDO4242459.1 substrate-binding domain-containing protein [Actinomyces sp.]